MPVGGAFPSYVGGMLTAVITTSGLNHGKDHEAVIRALCLMQKKDMPIYTGIMV
ncbi:MAG: heme-binding protein [Clostridium sp.]|nr:heme-binding protein [Clostridium sp.]